MATDMESFQARLKSFQTPHQSSKRRASSQKKTKNTTVAWPHENPTPEQLARAGFFYRPSSEDLDNVQCFLCSVKLDGWEPNDDPLSEHLAHSDSCAWALSLSVSRDDGEEAEARDPLSDQLMDARRKTFEAGNGWPHEGKRGWKCKIEKMVEAGWALDPSVGNEDGVTCFYCNLSLDGWEPKDDPFEEHRRRGQDCPFFALVQQYHGDISKSKAAAKRSGKSRSGSVSKAGRASTQSTVSAVARESVSFSDNGNDTAEVDDSIMTTGTVSSQATTKGKKKSTRSKAASSIAKGQQSAENPEKQVTADAKSSRRDLGRKGMVSSDFESEPEHKRSESAAQLQDELDLSMNYESPDDQATPLAESAKPKRGVKRSSDGEPKQEDSSFMAFEFPIPPKTTPQKAAKKGKKHDISANRHAEMDRPAKPLASDDGEPQHPSQTQGELEPSKTSKTKKAAAKSTRGKKASSARSSKATVTDTVVIQADVEDLEKDEEEIERELERIAAEQRALDDENAQVMEAEQEKALEYEASPSQQSGRKANNPRASQTNSEAERLENQQAQNSSPVSSHNWTRVSGADSAPTPSPSGSDKENQPSSLIQKSTDEPPTQVPVLSPTKTTRIPLAPSTPNRASPNGRFARASPSKQLQHLTSIEPWTEIDLDTILLRSTQPTPGKLGHQLALAAGSLGEDEQRMSVEEWVRWRAEISEKELRRKCEELVGVFEREGVRALGCLEGLHVVAQ